MFSMGHRENDYELWFVIKQVRADVLVCYPFFDQNNTLKTQFMDFDDDVETWMHIACTYSKKDNVQNGFIYISNQSIRYFGGTENSTLTYPAQSYRIVLNNRAGELKEGISQCSYKEVRVWQKARTAQELIVGRFQQLNSFTPEFNTTILAYFKLGNGGFQSASEINLREPELNEKLNFYGEEWVVQKGFRVCPTEMYHNFEDGLCY